MNSPFQNTAQLFIGHGGVLRFFQPVNVNHSCRNAVLRAIRPQLLNPLKNKRALVIVIYAKSLFIDHLLPCTFSKPRLRPIRAHAPSNTYSPASSTGTNPNFSANA